MKKKENINKIKYTIGLKHILNGHTENQKEIKNFIYNCKKYETREGFLTSDFLVYKIIKIISLTMVL